MRASSQRIVKRTAIGLGVLVLVLVVLIGVAHTSWGRPMLAWFGSVGVTGGCPVGLDQVADPTKLEELRKAELHKREGATPVRSTRALDFALGTTTRAEVDAWAARHGTPCEETRAGTALKCLPPRGDLFMQFDGAQRLVALDFLRSPASADEAASLFARQAAVVSDSAGPPTKTVGEADARWLEAAPMRHALREFRYAGFVASVSMTNLGARGLRVREQYQWAGN